MSESLINQITIDYLINKDLYAKCVNKQVVHENNKKDKEAKEKESKNADGTAKSQQEKIQAISGGDKELTQPQTCKPVAPYDEFYDITPTSNSSTFSKVKYDLNNILLLEGIDGSILKYVVFAAL